MKYSKDNSFSAGNEIMGVVGNFTQPKRINKPLLVNLIDGLYKLPSAMQTSWIVPNEL